MTNDKDRVEHVIMLCVRVGGCVWGWRWGMVGDKQEVGEQGRIQHIPSGGDGKLTVDRKCTSERVVGIGTGIHVFLS